MRTNAEPDRKLASRWFPPATVPGTDVGPGEPVGCISTTYTFDARLFEADLLPRFLGLKFDDSEGGRAFVIEREQKLATCRAVVLVDEGHVDGSQTTLRWDQLPVRVPRGAQHSKVVVLTWERCIRVIISSANLTKFGYRHNHEIAGALDFFNDASSPPRTILLDSLEFLETLTSSGWIAAADPVLDRLKRDLADIRRRVAGWRKMPREHARRETPRIIFAATLPRHGRNKQVTSPLDVLAEAWGTRRATDITVMTPFVGAGNEANNPDPVIAKLRQIPTTRNATGTLVTPGRLAEGQSRRVLIQLPRRFRDSWASAWRVAPAAIPIHIVPSIRKGAKVKGLRNLHAKAVLISDDQRAALLCGSSNFSPSGMGTGPANIEANWCYVHDDARYLRAAFPVDWPAGTDAGPFEWPEDPPPADEEPTAFPRVPACFLWATYSQPEAQLKIGWDRDAPCPTNWRIRIPGESESELVSASTYVDLLSGSEIVVPCKNQLTTACLIIEWTDGEGSHEAKLPINVTRPEDLPPPDEFLLLSLAAIIDCLASGRDPAEWIEPDGKDKGSSAGKHTAAIESLKAVGTDSFLLYRVRRLGQALSVLAERLVRSVRSVDAIRYRLLLDPFGPMGLAQAIVREADLGTQTASAKTQAASVAAFSLSEVALTMAHVAARFGKLRDGGPDLTIVFHELFSKLDPIIGGVLSDAEPDVRAYAALVKQRCVALVGFSVIEDRHAR